MEQQLSILEPNDEISLMKRDIIAMKESYDSVRRAMFARHNELAKQLAELKEVLIKDGYLPKGLPLIEWIEKVG